MRQFVKKNDQILLFGAGILFMGILLIWRAFYGMDITDETFYLATARRFHDGDMLFMDDWNTGQLFGILMLPFYQLYTLFHGSSEGIILCARIVFVLLEIFVSCFLFRVLWHQTKSFGAAFLSALCILVYTRGNIITLSYYSLGFLTFLLCVLWWAEAERFGDRKQHLILSGISFAVSVLCMPYMVLLFAVLAGIGVCSRVRGQGKLGRQVFWWGTGIAAAAAAFLIYFGRWIPWDGLLQYIPYMFQDTTMEKEGLLTQLRGLFLYFGTSFLKYMWPVYGLTFVLVLSARSQRLRNIKVMQWLPQILWMEFLVQSVYVRTYFEGGIIVTFFLLAVQMQFLNPECRCRQQEAFFVLPGLLFGLAWLLGSNVGERAVNMSLLFVDLWGISFLWKRCGKYGKRTETIMRLPVCLLFGVLFLIRMFDVYRDGALWDLKYRISCGSMKGIHTEAGRGAAYEQTVRLLQSETTQEDILVVRGCNPWVYMDTPAACGAYTTWNAGDGRELLELYYEVRPDKIPNVVLSVSKEIDQYTSWRYSSHGAGFHESEQSGEDGSILYRPQGNGEGSWNFIENM